MDMAYSILLGEMVGATEVDYGDPERFKITCPVCMEAVFKAGEYKGKRQYFSHYRETKSDVKRCELRVAQMQADAVNAANLIGRGQTLAGFLESYQELIIQWLFPDTTRQSRQRTNYMVTRPHFRRICDRIRQSALLTRDNDPDAVWDDIEHVFSERRGTFWTGQQKRFAMDFYDHLLAENSKPAFNFLLCVINLFLLRTETDHVVWRCMVNGTDRQVRKQTIEFDKLMVRGEMATMRVADVVKGGPPTYFHGILFLIMERLYALLFCLPYFQFLDHATDPAMAVQNRELLITLFRKKSDASL